ncbi:hypothetical protein C8J57DRAFT_1251298 [Mycena rebaudengoi]|nr:hypothetical protein C8J57DRAFT_1251298 [Mycena rebaudengoi]
MSPQDSKPKDQEVVTQKPDRVAQLGSQYRATAFYPSHGVGRQIIHPDYPVSSTDGEAVKHFWSNIEETMDAGDRQTVLEDFWACSLLTRYKLVTCFLLTRYLPATLCPGLRPFNYSYSETLLPSTTLPHPKNQMSYAPASMDDTEKLDFATAVIEIATVQLAWQRDSWTLHRELGKELCVDDPTLDTETRNLILAGKAVDAAWNDVLEYCCAEAFAALAIAIHLDPNPPDSDKD